MSEKHGYGKGCNQCPVGDYGGPDNPRSGVQTDRCVNFEAPTRSLAGEAAQPNPFMEFLWRESDIIAHRYQDWMNCQHGSFEAFAHLMEPIAKRLEETVARLAVSTPPVCPTCNQPKLPLNAGSCGCAAALSPAQAANELLSAAMDESDDLADELANLKTLALKLVRAVQNELSKGTIVLCNEGNWLLDEVEKAASEPSAQAVAGEPSKMVRDEFYRKESEKIVERAAPEPVAEPPRKPDRIMSNNHGLHFEHERFCRLHNCDHVADLGCFERAEKGEGR